MQGPEGPEEFKFHSNFSSKSLTLFRQERIYKVHS